MSLRARRGALLCVGFLSACGDDGGAAPADAALPDAPLPVECEVVGGAACFELPAAPAQRSDGSAPNWACAKPEVITSTAEISVAGNAWDYLMDTKPLPSAEIAAFD